MTLNKNTTENSLIGTVYVLTHSKAGYRSLNINQDHPFFVLKSENLYLKKPGSEVFKTVNFVMLLITAADLNEPSGFFKVAFFIFICFFIDFNILFF